jgi:hypothetical protein
MTLPMTVITDSLSIYFYIHAKVFLLSFSVFLMIWIHLANVSKGRFTQGPPETLSKDSICEAAALVTAPRDSRSGQKGHSLGVSQTLRYKQQCKTQKS